MCVLGESHLQSSAWEGAVCVIICVLLCVSQVKSIFSRARGEVVCLCPPGDEERRKFFSDLILVQATRAPRRRRNTGALGPRGHLAVGVGWGEVFSGEMMLGRMRNG